MQMLPLKINKTTFYEIEKCLSKFIWHGKKPRLKMKVLQLPYDSGGQALPNLQFYYWACHIRIISGWLHSILHQPDPHVDNWCCESFSLLSLLSLDLNKLPAEVKNNDILFVTFRVWHNIRCHLGRKNFSSAMQPLINNVTFSPGIGHSIFNNWHNKGLKLICNFFEKDVFLSFEQIQNRFGIPQKDFFGFLQMRHYVRSSLSFPGDLPILNPIEIFLLKFNENTIPQKKFISLCYTTLMESNSQTAHSARSLWEADMGTELGDEIWSNAFVSAKKIFTCNRLRENQYRILHRLQRTPRFLHKISPQISPFCIKCKNSVGTYYHCVWQCPIIQRFWRNVATELHSIFHQQIPVDSMLFLFGHSVRPIVPPGQMMVLCKLLHVARRCILLQWIQVHPPSVTQWYREIFKILPMERVSALAKGNSNFFYKTWHPLLDYLPRNTAEILCKGGSHFLFKEYTV